MIETPVISNYVRDGVSGTIDVSVVDDLLTVEVYGIAVAGGVTAPLFLAGSRLGSGEVTLDVSAASTLNFANGILPVCQLFAVAKDGSDNYGPPSVIVTPPLFNFVTTPPTVVVGDRSIDGTSVDVTVAGLASTSVLLVFWTNINDTLGLVTITGSGVLSITGLDPNTNYIFIGIPLNTNFQCQTIIVFHSNRLPYVPSPLPTTFLRKTLTQDAVYWAFTGSDAYGQAELAAPVQIKCRWQDQEVMFTGASGAQMLSVAKVYPDRDLTLEGFLMRGTLDDLNSDMLPDYGISAFPIRAKEEHPDLKGKKSHLTVFLQKKIMSGKIKGGG